VGYALRNHLWEVIGFAIRDGFRQWTTVSDSMGFLAEKERLLSGSGAGYDAYYAPIIAHYPNDAKQLDQSRLSQGTLMIHRIVPFPINLAIAWALSLIVIGFLATRKQFFSLSFMGASMIFVTLNTFLTGALAGVANRKQARVVWIVLYAVLTSIFAYWLKRRKELLESEAQQRT
jgi:hypothetical protein